MAKRSLPAKKGRARARKAALNGATAPIAAPAHESPRIVGIGASAGGLEAFTGLLHALPTDTGMAFVLVQHLEPKHESVLTTLLARATKMPVHEVSEGMHVEPNQVYVIPANADLSMVEGLLHIVGRKAAPGRHLPIDYFLCSLAATQGPRAVGVILSGTASDGTAGIRAIKQEGGVTFAQDPASAKFDGMPRSAINTGCVDFVLPPERIARELARMVRQPLIGLPPLESVPALPAHEEDWARLYRILRTATGVDFSLYKKATIKRRLARRMDINKVSTIGAYLDILDHNRPEVDALFDELLILVTEFFRDQEVFEALQQKIFPRILKQKPAEDPVRVWVAGCSGGQEAYSIAIALLECLGERAPGRAIQIFGTDASESAIEKARAGIYSPQELKPLSENRVARFFKRINGDYQINERIRELCVFARHDLIRDPPFSKLDLVSCRNVLIYFEPALQKRALAAFYYGLRNEGALMLGKSESLGAHSDVFSAIDRKLKFFRKNTAAHVPFNLVQPAHEHGAPGRQPKEIQPPANLEKEADLVVWERSAFAGLVVNDDLQILHFRGDTSPYLRPVPGKASLQLMRILREDIVLEVRSAIQKARRAGRTARAEGVEIQHNRQTTRINIEVRPLAHGGSEKNFLILFEPASASQPPPAARPAKAAGTRPTHEELRLQTELARIRDYVQSIVRDQETTNEELKTANEEALSSMEELQSTNEELETAKEELQSSNEELVTLNEQLQNRNTELAQTTGDLGNILSGVDIAIVILDQERRIRRFTPPAEKLLGLITGDTGRPISKIHIGVHVPDLDTLISEVMIKGQEVSREVKAESGRWFLLRVHPFRGTEDKIEGVLMAFVDIQDLKQHQEALARDRNFIASVLDAAQDLLVVVLNPAGGIERFNTVCHQVTGYSLEEVRGLAVWDFLLPPEEVESVKASFRAAIAGAPNRSLNYLIAKNGRRLLISWSNSVVKDGGAVVSLISTGIDVTEREEARRRALEKEATVRAILENAAQAILACDREGRIKLANPTAATMFGYPVDKLIGRPLETLLPERLRGPFAGHLPGWFAIPRDGMAAAGAEIAGLRQDGSEFPIDVRLSHIGFGEGMLGVAFVSDVAERKKSEQALMDYREQQLAAEVSTLGHLAELTERLWRLRDMRSGLEEMINAGVALLGADMGSIQLLNPEKRVLEMAAQCGFTPAYLDYLREVSADEDSASGQALRAHQRMIIEDVETDPAFAPHRSIAAAAGYRAVQFTPLFGKNGETIGMFSTCFREPHRPGDDELRRFDLYARQAVEFVERIRTEERLQLAESTLRRLLETVGRAILTVTQEGRIRRASSLADQMFGWPPGSLVGQPIESLIPERLRARHDAGLAAWFKSPQNRPLGSGLELTGLRKDGSEFQADISLSFINTAEGVLGIASVVDLTERQRQEQILADYKQELQKLTAALISARETASRETARELHDDLNQRVAMLANEVVIIQRGLASQPASGLRLKLDSLRAKLDELSDGLRRLAYQLHPPALDHLGLAAALKALCSEFSQQHPFKLELLSRHVPFALPPEVALCLYRITQECLSNIAKHSGATEAKVTLQRNKRALRLSVSDNGRGFDPAAKPGGLGLVNIRERVRMVSGSLSIDASPGHGTRIAVEVPLEEAAG